MRRRALLIGTGTYEHPDFTDLRSPTADLIAIETALRHGGEFEDPVVLTNPTRGEAHLALETILKDGGPNDLALISISGHGSKNDFGRLHFVMRDTRPNLLSSTAIAAKELHTLLEEKEIGSTVLLLDCCYSGAFADSFATRGDGDRLDLRRELESEGTYVIAASGPLERAYEGDNSDGVKPSPFSAAVAEGLSGHAADINGDGWVDAVSLYTYVHRQIDNEGRQRVTQCSAGVRGTLRLARHVQSLTATDAADDPRRRRATSDEPAVSSTAERSGPDSDPAAIEPHHDPGSSPERTVPGTGPGFRFDTRTWRALFTYLRSCVARQSVLQQLPDVIGQSYAACAMGTEQLVSGLAEFWEPHGAAAVVTKAAVRDGAALRLGYPAVLFDAGRDGGRGARAWKIAPLFALDVEAVDVGGRVRLVPSGDPELNTELLAAAGELDPDELADLTTWFAADWGNRGVAGLGDKARSVCERAGIANVHPLVPGELRAEVDLARPHRAGAQNVALVHTVDSAAGAIRGLLTDLDPDGTSSLRLERVAETSLATLAGESAGAETERAAHLVVPGAGNSAQESVLRSAMYRRLTVATGAPGTGKSELITAAVTTAVAAGDSVLVASTNNTAVNEVVTRANKLLPGADLIVRTGNQTYRSREQEILTALRSARFDPIDVATTAERVSVHQRNLTDASAAVAEAERAERRLAVLAPARQEAVERLPAWISPGRFAAPHLADRLFGHVDKVLNGHWTGRWHRWLIARALGRVPSPADLRTLGRFLHAECEWRDALAALDRTPDPEQAHQRIGEVRSRRRVDGASLVVGRMAGLVARGGAHIDARVQALAAGNAGWKALSPLLKAVPAWATTSRSARFFPPNPGLFDLVIVDEASQCTLADLVPLLYRAKRALIIGDPHQLQPVNTLAYHEDRRFQRGAGLHEQWLEDRSLVFSRSSAYHAAASALAAQGGEILWLDEHYRCHPDIIGPANRRFYGERLAVRTRTHELVAPGDPAVRWIDVRGTAERPGGRSCRNVEEAEQVIGLLRDLWRELPATATIGVATPFTAQLREIDRLLGGKGGDRIRTGTVHTFQGGECDAVVISPAAATGVDPGSGRWAGNQHSLWNVAITRARSRLYIVGDEHYWRSQNGVLADIAAQTAGLTSEVGRDEARTALFSALSEAGAAPIAGADIGGYRCDLRTPTAHGDVALLIDWAGSRELSTPVPGRALHRILDKAALLQEIAGLPVRRVPAWRCLTEPEAVAAEVLGGR